MRLTLLLAATLAGCAASPSSVDLQTFLERRATCDHFRGEIPDPPDEARMREVIAQIEVSCPGSDAQLAQMKRRYRDDPEVSRRLGEFEERIER